MPDNEGLRVVALKEDEDNGCLVVHFQRGTGESHEAKIQEDLVGIVEDIHGSIATERYLRGDSSAHPYWPLVSASDASIWFFESRPSAKQLDAYLINLAKSRVSLYRKAIVLEELQIKFRAGKLANDDPTLLGVLPRLDDPF